MSANFASRYARQPHFAGLRNELDRLQDAARDIGNVQLGVDPRGLSTLQQANALLAQVRANAVAAGQGLSGLSNQSSVAAQSAQRLGTALSGTAAQSRALAAGTRTATGDVARFASGVGAAAAAVAGLGAGVGQVSQVMRASVKGALDFDLALVKLRQVSGDTAAEVRAVGAEVSRLASGMGSSSSDLLEAAVTLKQAGLATRDVKTVLQGVAEASLAPNFSSTRQVVEGAIAGFQQFGKSVSNVRQQLGAMNAVAGDFATEAADLVSVVQRAGGTASQTGASFNELLAIFTSIRSTTRESADAIGTGLRTIFGRLQRNDTVDALNQLGINLRYTRGEAEALGQVDMEGQFVGAYEAVRRLSEGLSKIRTTDPRFASALEELGGVRQLSRTIPMIQQFGEAQKALNVARLGSASLEAAAAIRQDALTTKMAKTREAYQALANDLFQSRGVKAYADTALTLAEALGKVLDIAKPLIPLMLTLGTVRLAQGLVPFGAGIYQTFAAQGAVRSPGRMKFATGGVVPGAGSGDTVPAQLEPGEFVVRRQAAQQVGYGALHAVNAGRFAGGGFVNRALGRVRSWTGTLLMGGSMLGGTVAPAQAQPLVSAGDALELRAREELERRRTMAKLGLGPGGTGRPGFAEGGAVGWTAGGAARPGLDAVIQRVLARVGYGRNAQEQMSEAGERIARAVASGKIPTDPAEAERHLLNIAFRGAKTADQREARLARRQATGVLTSTGHSVLDLVAAKAGTVPLSGRAGRRGRAGAEDVAQTVREGIATGRLTTADLRDPVLAKTLGVTAHQALLSEHGLLKPALTAEYVVSAYQRGETLRQIAESVGSYPNAVLRLLRKQGIPIRSKGEAQALALATGRHTHPTKGTAHSEETKRLIGQGVRAAAAAKKVAETPPLRPVNRLLEELKAGDFESVIRRINSRQVRPVAPEAERLAREFERIQAGQAAPSAAQASLVSSYIGDSRPYNAPLLAGLRPAAGSRELAAFLSRAALPRAVKAFRGLSADAHQDLTRLLRADPFSPAAVGRTATYPAFLSTTLAPSTAAEFDTGGGTLTLLLRKGAPAAAVGRATRGGAGQSELLMPPGRLLKVVAPGRLEVFRDGGLAAESTLNMQVAHRALRGIGLPPIDLSKLVSALHFVKKPVLGADTLGGFNPTSKFALVREDAPNRLPVLAHEVLGHAASRRAAEMAGVDGWGSTTLGPFAAVAVQSLRHLLPQVMSPATFSRYMRSYQGRTELMADEGLAWGVEAYVQNLAAKAGHTPLPERLKSVFRSTEVKRLFGMVRDDIIPEVRRLTGRNMPAALPDSDDELTLLRQGIQGQTVRPRKLATGGLVPGPAGDWTDSVRADLPAGSYVVRKSTVRAVGTDALATLAQGRRFAAGGVVPALVMPGEYVFGPDEAARVGRPALDRLNTTGRLPEFAAGGPVQPTTGYWANGRFIQTTQPMTTYGFAPGGASGYTAAAAQAQLAQEAASRARADRTRLRQAGLTPTGAATVGDARTLAAVNGAGGAALLSASTVLATQQAQHAKVEQELTRGIQRQLQALHPAITAIEARRKAEEMARAALEQNAAVLRNARGQVVGSAALGIQLAEAGRSPTGAAATYWQAARERVARAGQWAARSFTPQGGMIGTYGLMMGAPMLAEQVGPSKEDVKVAAMFGETGGAKATGAAAGGLQFAAMGAGIGMAFGPWGMAIGAAAGGLVGLAQGFKQTDREIREAKVGMALQNLSDMLSNAANNVRSGGVNGINPGALKRELDFVQAEAEAKTRDATERAWYNPMRLSRSTALKSDEVAQVRQRELRVAFGGQAGAMVALLSRQAEDLGRTNPNAGAADLARRMSTDPASGQLLARVATVRGESVEKVLREFADTVEAAQRRVRVETEVNRGRVAAEQSATALTRLSDAVTNAANSVSRYDTAMTVLGSVFAGQGGTGRVAPVTGGFAAFGTGTGTEFRQSAGAVGAALGPAGGAFLRSAEAGDRLARVLPSVLTTLGTSTLGANESYGPRARSLLYAQLLPGLGEAQRRTALEANPELARAIESAVGAVVRLQADTENDGGLVKRLQQDPGKVAQEVAEAFTGPLKDAGERMARAVEDHANRVVDGLAAAGQMFVAAGETRDRVGDIRLGARRAEAEVYGDRAGMAAADLLSLRDLQAPLAERQQRLTGLGAAAEDPAAVAARLRRMTSDIAAATAERDAAVGTRDRFAAAAGHLDRLVGASSNLQAALRNLANVSERAAGIQEKLTAANANRDGRLGYAEKYLFADPEGRARMQRGQQLVIGLDRGRTTFNALSVDEQRLAAETLGDFGQTRLASGRTAAGLRQQLIGGMPGVIDAGQEGARQGLQDQLLGVFATAEQAQRALAAYQQDVHARFISDLTRLHEQFFARLGTNVAAEATARARNDLAAATVARSQQAQEERQRGVLNRVGVRDQAGLQALRGSQGDVRTFLDANNRLAALRPRPVMTDDARDAIRQNWARLSDQLRGNPWTVPQTDLLRDVMRTRGLDTLSGEGQEVAVRAVTDRMSYFGRNPVGLARWKAMNQDERIATIQDAVARGMTRGRDQTETAITAERDKAGEALRGRGVNTDALARLSGGEQATLTEALRSTATDLGTLDDRVRETEASMARFRGQLDRAEAALRGASVAETGTVPIRRADGGFTPRGTDTVPAMLTPGEFVINRASTQANLPLLREINAARGPVQYREDGGVIRRAAEAYVWTADKMNKGLQWLGFADGGNVPTISPLPADLLQELADYNRRQRQWQPAATVAAGDAVAANRRRRDAARAAGPRRPTPAELLAGNRLMNARSMAFSQALFRSGMDDGQMQAALGSVAQLRDVTNRQFLDRHGAVTAPLRMQATEAWRVGAWARAESVVPAETREAARRVREALRPRARYASGGVVGGSGSGDTVPALLTPGEGVLNTRAMSVLGPNFVHRFNQGGVVPGSSASGPGPSGIMGLSQEARAAMDSFAGTSKDLGTALTGFATPAGLLASALQGFSAGAEKLTAALNGFKGEVSHSYRGNIVVDLNGAEALTALRGELQESLTGTVMRQVVDYVDRMFPDTPRPPRADLTL